ncbi:MAG TPA: GNAT family N-acetyltransferase [Chthonomonadaceae bacterium]|nr:GNAT family N-acetyltransferase [Chthonomonadaceae bacterium]
MEIRVLSGEEEEQAWYVWSQAFERGDREMREWREWRATTEDKSVTFGVFDAAGLQATVLVTDYRIHLGPEVIVPMGGIGGVACLPASRGKGYAGAGLRASLEGMREAGQVVSVLFPFSWEYYRRFGWEWVGVNRHYAIPSRVLRPDPETENVRAATPADRSAIVGAYTEFAGRYRGMLARRGRTWAEMLDDKEKEYTYTYLYEKEGKVEGYLTYRGGKEEGTRLGEFLSLRPRAQRALLGLLRRHDMQINKFTWHAPEDDTLWQQYYHWDFETKIQPVTMGRVVDVVGALQSWRPDRKAGGVVMLAVQDEHAPWNARTWKVEFAGGEVAVRPAEAAPQVALDIQALSQAYFGTPTLDQLRAADRLAVYDEAGYTALRDLLAGPPMWLNDEF